MPELPEVETVVRDLQPRLVGRRITDFSCRTTKLLNRPLREFRRGLVGQVVRRAWRRGKLILFDLSGGSSLGIHLKMTGQLLWLSRSARRSAGGGHPIVGQSQLPNRFTHVTFTFSDGAHLYFNDVRQFGRLKLLVGEELDAELARYGLEPLTEGFDQRRFLELLAGHQRTTVKRLLLDQRHIAGLGNLYADEVCFAARVRPTRLVARLRPAERPALFRAIKRVLAAAVAKRGTTFRDYRDPAGERGNYQSSLRVYGRAGQPCRSCRRPIVKTRHTGRGTHFCPRCQN